MISDLTMERPAVTPMAASVGAALIARPPFDATGLPGPYAPATLAAADARATRGSAVMGAGLGIAIATSDKCHDWAMRDRQGDFPTLRPSRHLRSPRT